MGYIVWTPPHPKGAWLAEGDTHTFLNFLDNGLQGHVDETWGAWAGRRRTIPSGGGGMGFSRAPDTAMPLEFLPAAQNELAARFKWAVTPQYKDANHHPVIEGPFAISAPAGEKVALKVKVTDPDKDAVTLQWVQFKVGTYEGDVSVEDPVSASTSFTVPSDAKPGETIHLVLEAKDSGSPALYRYHRVIITVN